MKHVILLAALLVLGTSAFAQKTVLQVQDAGGDRAIIEAPALSGNRTLTIPDYTGTILVTSSAMGTNRAVRTNSLGEIETVALTNGQLLIGSTGNAPQVGSLTGTANQITVTPGAGTITLSLPQSIATSSNVTFNNLQTLGGLDVGGGTLAGAANTYLYLRAAGASTDVAYLRQIGGTDAYHLTIDIYDNLTGNQFSIRSVQPTTGDTASALNLSDNVLTLGYGAQGSATRIVMNDATTGTSNTGTMTVTALTGNRTYTLPDVSGTVAISGSIGIDDLSDAKSGGANFSNSIVLGHQNVGGINGADQNTAVGIGTIQNITTGTYNTALGYTALQAITTGQHNTAIGGLAMRTVTTGSANVAIGMHAMDDGTTSGNYNTVVGTQAGFELDGTAAENTAVGGAIFRNSTTGNQNTAIGYSAMYNGGTGSFNTAIGSLALRGMTTGSNNVALGTESGWTTSTGSGNIFIGYRAGFSETGSDKLYIDNSGTASPLIYGDFSSNNLMVNGALTLQAATSDYNTSNVDAANLTNTYLAFGTAGAGSDWSYLRQIGSADNYHVAWDFHDNANDTRFSIRSVESSGQVPDVITTRLSLDGSGNFVVSGHGTFKSHVTLQPSSSVEGGEVILQKASNTAVWWAIDQYEGDNEARLRFLPTSGGETFGMVIEENDGHVGIGTANPTTRLQLVSGGAFGVGDDPISNNAAGISIRNTNNTSGTAHAVLALASAGAGGGDPYISWDITSVGGWSMGIDNSDNDKLKLYELWDFPAAGTAVMTFDRVNDRVGVFTENPTDPFHVRTGAQTAVRITTTTADLSASTDRGLLTLEQDNATPSGVDQEWVVFVQNGNVRGTIVSNGTGNVAYNSPSDYRLKTDLREFSGTALVRDIPVYDYQWIESGHRQYGFMAHELQAVVPYLVHGTKDAVDENGKPIYQMLDYSKITPILTKAIQEQQAVIESQEQRIQKLEALVKELLERK